jgi:hypothetical protein
MSIEADMSTPVTRGELIDAMSTMARGLIEQIEMRFQEFRQELNKDIARHLGAFREDFRQELNKDIARHLGAYHEAMLTQISVIDEKYADVPGRVARLEAKVTGEPS